MSLINEALKRAQRAQVPPSSPDSLTLMPAMGKRGNPRWVKPLAFGSSLVTFSIAIWLVSSGGKPADQQDQPTPPKARGHTWQRTEPAPPTKVPVTSQSPGAPTKAGPALQVSLKTEAPQTAPDERKNEVPALALSNPVAQGSSPAPSPGAAVRPDATRPAGALNPAARTEELKTANASADLVVYVVRPRDTLGRIAKLHHTTIKVLRGINDLKSERILAGQKLKVPVSS